MFAIIQTEKNVIMKTMFITCTKGYAAKVDAEDWARLVQYRYHSVMYGPKNHQRRPRRWVRNAPGRRRIQMGNDVLRLPPGILVDHINRDPWDNRKENLRVVTASINSFNSTTKPPAISGRKHVKHYKTKQKNPFDVLLRRGTEKRRWRFLDVKSAVLFRNQMRRELWPEIPEHEHLACDLD